MPIILLGNLLGVALVYGFILRSPLGIGLGCVVGYGAAVGLTGDPLGLIPAGVALAVAILLRLRSRRRTRAAEDQAPRMMQDR